MKLNFLILLLLLSISAPSALQEQVKINGTLSLAANSDSVFLNFGGPNIRFDGSGLFYGASFFPSLRYDTSDGDVFPLLGAGVFVGRDQFFFQIPTYYYGGSWYSAVGMGYKF